MREKALELLVCPKTHKRLNLEVEEINGEHIIEGFLSTDSGEKYPIIAGVPRMLPMHLLPDLAADYPAFAEKYPAYFQGLGEESDAQKVQRHTQEAFGHEWTWAGDYDADNFEDWLPDGHDAQSLFAGKQGLEVGCGAGRHANKTSTVSREHFAVDLSIAVDSAFERNRDVTNCHIIQADAFNLPFLPAAFEYVYCLGVLQHMHDPPAGFRYLAKQPKAGGVLLVNVYQAGRPIQLFILNSMRAVTTRMSNTALQRLCEIIGVLEYVLTILPWKLIKPSPLGKILQPLIPERLDEYAKHSMRTCIVDWFDRLSCPVKIHYTKEQMQRWYQENGYDEVAVTPYWQAFWNGYGIRKQA